MAGAIASAESQKIIFERGGNLKEDAGARPWALLGRCLGLCLAMTLVWMGTWTSARAASPGGDENMLIPVGRAVGIKLFSDGVMVVGLAQVPGEEGAETPAKDCGLRQGDIITHINSTQVDTIEQVKEILQDLEGEDMSIRAIRDDKQVQFTARAVQCSDGSYRLGAWIRDSMAGIGTMTYYDPESGQFAALGHGVNDVDTAMLMPMESGGILYASVAGVKKGESGEPGELHGAFQSDQELGALYANTDGGVFGTLTDESLIQGLEPVPVAARDQVKVGPAVILSNVEGDTVEEYAVEITRLYPEGSHDTRELTLKVTDSRLLEKTGGIVQGMSGSPILQDGRLVGAVTHVLVNDPSSGYGILAETMLKQGNEAAENA